MICYRVVWCEGVESFFVFAEHPSKNCTWNCMIKFDRGYRKYCFRCRTLYVAARENQFPEVLSYVNIRRVTPIPCIIFTVSLQSETCGEINHKTIENHSVDRFKSICEGIWF